MLEELIKQVGKPYQKYDEFGLASGCMAPVWFLYPDIPRYDWPEDETRIAEYMEELFVLHAKIIDLDEMQPGDLIMVQMLFGLVHPGVYLGSGRMLHCMKETGWESMRISRARVKGVYRVWRQQ